MFYLTKFTLALIAVCLGLGMNVNAIAQENTVAETVNEVEKIEEVILDETVEAEDLETSEPRLLPDSPFYFLKEWGRGIQSLFTFGRLKKSELEQKFADERIIELKELIEEGKDSKFIGESIEKYERTMEKIRTRTEKIEENAEENEEVEKFLGKFTRHQLLHQKILEKLEEQIPEEVFQKIKEVREKHLERFGEVMTKLEDREEKIREKLEEALEEQKGSKYKNFKNLEVLIELEEKVPEQAKEAIREVQENALKRLKGDLEKMSPEDQERFKEYIDKISGDKEKQLEILENLKAESKEEPELEKTMIQARERILKRIQEKTIEMNCSLLEGPPLDFCVDGRIIVTKNPETGCPTEVRCIIPGEIEISEESVGPTETKPEVCPTLWDPVCGVDGKTYSNECTARIAGVVVVYKGRCKEENTCDQECKSKGYRSGICRSWTVVPTVKWGCEDNEANIGETSDCTTRISASNEIEGRLVGVGKACCCQR